MFFFVVVYVVVLWKWLLKICLLNFGLIYIFSINMFNHIQNDTQHCNIHVAHTINFGKGN